jgi:hypothetical protein
MTIKVLIKGKEIRMSRKEFVRRFGQKPYSPAYHDKEYRSRTR